MSDLLFQKEKPILFSGEMVRAILAGRKTMTRRVAKFQEFGCFTGDCPHEKQEECDAAILAESPYRKGGALWVKETFAIDNFEYLGKLKGKAPADRSEIYYAAAGADLCAQIPECDCSDGVIPWRPSIFMPRWASRINLPIVAVRAESLQDITPEDAIAEGIPLEEHKCGCERCAMTSEICPATGSSLILAFARLWDGINADRNDGKYAWDENPVVWVVEFPKYAA